MLILYIDRHLYRVLFLLPTTLDIHMYLGILRHLSALAVLSDLRSGSACRAAATPVCSYPVGHYYIHGLYATYLRVAVVRWRQAAYSAYQGSMGWQVHGWLHVLYSMLHAAVL